MAHAGGRPPVVNDEVVQKLEQALQNGFTIGKACELSGISTSTYYNYIEADERFLVKMTNAQNFALETARQNIVKAIVKDKDIQTSRWYLERKAKSEFSTRNELTGADGMDFKPIVVEIIDVAGKDKDTNTD